MKFLKKLLFVLITVVVIFLVIPLFVDSDFKVSRSATVPASKMVVFDYLKYLKNQEEYGVWNNIDPDMKKSYNGTDGEVGFTYTWDSQNEDVGAGEQEIVAINEYDKIEYELRFQRPWESTNQAWFDIEGNTDSTKITWAISGSVPYPFNFFNLFMDMDEMIGEDLEKGLEKLESEISKK
ncbi:MAG: SRPBCC family protein [Crocinitomicaceae bacterium]